MWIKLSKSTVVEMKLGDMPGIDIEVLAGGATFSSLSGDLPHVVTSGEETIGILMPAAPAKEIYRYDNGEGEVILTDSFFKLLASVEKLTESPESIDFFMKKNIFPPGKTLYVEISRLLPTKTYLFDARKNCSEPGDIGSDRSKSISVTYKEFERIFDHVVEKKVRGKDVGILLSSGFDSTAIALSAAKCAKSIKSFTMGYQPQISGVAKDVIGARHTAEYLGIEHKIIGVDVGSYSTESLALFVKNMPMTAGLPVGYERLLEVMSEDSISVALTGQNADLLYNLSATDKLAFNRSGMTALFRRWFMTDSYFKYLDKSVQTNIISRVMHSCISNSGAGLYSFFKGGKYLAPRDCSEAYYSFTTSPDSVVFKKQFTNFKIEKELDSNNIYEMLVRNKLEQDMMLCDSQMIRRAADTNKVDVSFPFSDGDLIDFWIDKQMTLGDVIYPKRYIRQYVSNHFPEYSQRDGLKVESDIGYDAHTWAKKVVSSDFGKSLNAYANVLPAENVTPYKYLMYMIASFWIAEIRRVRASHV